MSNHVSYKLSFRATKADFQELKKYLEARENFPYFFAIIQKHNEWQLTVQAEEGNRGFSGPDGYLMEMVMKFSEIIIPYCDDGVQHSGVEYDDDKGSGFLSKKEEGFQKIKDK